MSSSTTPMLSDSALRSDEIPDGYLSLDEKVLTYIPHDSAPQQINLVDCVGASAADAFASTLTAPRACSSSVTWTR